MCCCDHGFLSTRWVPNGDIEFVLEKGISSIYGQPLCLLNQHFYFGTHRSGRLYSSLALSRE